MSLELKPFQAELEKTEKPNLSGEQDPGDAPARPRDFFDPDSLPEAWEVSALVDSTCTVFPKGW